MKPIYKKCFVRMFCYLAYGFAGAWLFSLIEGRDEPYSVTSHRLLSNLRKEMEVKYNMTNSTDFDKFVEIAFEASKLKRKLDWTVINGSAFTYAALTTVGFGDITPQTVLGKALTIPYCTIGLPISMLALKTAGEVLVIFIHSLAVNLNKKAPHQKSHPKQTIFKCLVITLVSINALICILATAEMYMDGWTFVEGIYCWFITLTTIGFGDYVPFYTFKTQKEGKSTWVLVLAGIAFAVPCIIGLCLVSCLLNLLVDYSESIKVQSRKLGLCVICCSPQNNNEVDAAITDDITLKSIASRRFSV